MVHRAEYSPVARDELVWLDELTDVRGHLAELRPAARTAIRGVLEALLDEKLEPTTEASVLSLYDELVPRREAALRRLLRMRVELASPTTETRRAAPTAAGTARPSRLGRGR